MQKVTRNVPAVFWHILADTCMVFFFLCSIFSRGWLAVAFFILAACILFGKVARTISQRGGHSHRSTAAQRFRLLVIKACIVFALGGFAILKILFFYLGIRADLTSTKSLLGLVFFLVTLLFFVPQKPESRSSIDDARLYA